VLIRCRTSPEKCPGQPLLSIEHLLEALMLLAGGFSTPITANVIIYDPYTGLTKNHAYILFP